MKEAVCQCSGRKCHGKSGVSLYEKYLDKIETADIIETVMMNQKRVYLYRKKVLRRPVRLWNWTENGAAGKV